MATRPEFPHLRLEGRERAYGYTNPTRGGGGEFQRPPRDRVLHAKTLHDQLTAAEQAATQRGLTAGDILPLVYELQPHALALVQQAEAVRSGIELLNAVPTPSSIRATIRVPPGKQKLIRGVLDRYATEIDTRSNRPKRQDFVENIDAIRLATERDLWTDSEPFPAPEEAIWWEVWLYHNHLLDTHATWQNFTDAADEAGLRVKNRFVSFPDRVVGLVYGTQQQWEAVPRLFLYAAELRKAKELPTDYAEVEPRFQSEVVADLARRIEPPDDAAPAVCLLDTGVAREHPLLAPALAARDAQSVDPEWGASDDHPQQHGTTMGGIALYGTDLPEASRATHNIPLAHRLESVKILPSGGNDEPECYGALTQQAVARAEITAPKRRRANCLTLTADSRDGGLPSSWSAAIDQLCFGGEIAGEPKLVCAAAGNLRDQIFEDDFQYPMIEGASCGVEDPGQAWNALTVGAITERVIIQQADFDGYTPIAPVGDLSPTSRTSQAWPEEARRGWPIKPDVVMEGGNWARSPSGSRDAPDDLGLLTTALHPTTGALFSVTRDTSPATAQAARLAAQIWAVYPALWAETVRGLIVHSARWTEAMLRRFPDESKATTHDRLRCYGYGVPSLSRALDNTITTATLVFEGQLQPYKLDGAEVKTDQMHVHSLPWPVAVLEELGAEPITMRVTLSYFIEPSPGRRGWTRRHRYASHGLRFDLQRPTETLEGFVSRTSDSALDDESLAVDHVPGDALPWQVGSTTRSQGSLHSDWWTGTAADLASCRHLAVFPVTGWWRERKHLDRWSSSARYSLIVTLESDASDIYTAVSNQLAVTTDVRV